MIIDDKVIMALPPPPPYLYYSPSSPSQSSSPTFSTTHNYNPPPPFSEALHSPAHAHGTSAARPLKFSSLPPHILLQIVYNTFPTHPGLDAALVERQRKTLLWLARSLRLVNRAFYTACMHVLRSTYLPAYASLLRPYYSSDPFPSGAEVPPQAHAGALNTVQRETPVLDLFIALKVKEDVLVDDSELHLEREDMFKDLFDHAQPKARLEDLVRVYGVREGVVTLAPPGVVVYSSTSGSSAYSYSANSSHSSSSSSNKTVMPPAKRCLPLPLPSPTPSDTAARSPTSRFFSAFKRASSAPCSKPSSPPSSPPPASLASVRQQHQQQPPRLRVRPVPFALLSISFSTRKVGLQLMSVGTGSKRTIVEIQRAAREESLEAAAERIVEELKGLLLGC